MPKPKWEGAPECFGTWPGCLVLCGLVAECREETQRRLTPDEDPTPDYYNNEYKGINLDPYRVADIWNIQNNMQFHIFKKSARMHKENHKTLEENLDDIIKTCQRWKEMIKEDREYDN